MFKLHRHLLALTAITLTLFAAACGDSSNGELPVSLQRYAMASGGQTGVYYPTAVGISQQVDKVSQGLIEVRATGGSGENAQLLRKGSVGFAIMQNDIAAYAREGTLMFAEYGPDTSLLGVAALYPEHVQLVTLANSGINSVADLEGKSVVLGAIGSGSEANAKQVLEVYGMSTDDLGRIERLKPAEAADYLQDGRVDAAFFTFGLGTASIQTLAESKGIKLVPIDGEARAKLIEKYPFYSEAVISVDAYRGVSEEVPTVSVMATLVASEKTPAAAVQTVLKSVFDNIDDFRRTHARLGGVSRESAEQGLTLPLHPGAKAFYEGGNASAEEPHGADHQH